jgi:hypothetical protein
MNHWDQVKPFSRFPSLDGFRGGHLSPILGIFDLRINSQPESSSRLKTTESQSQSTWSGLERLSLELEFEALMFFYLPFSATCPPLNRQGGGINVVTVKFALN